MFQHFGKDPLPWAQDVSGRVTANAGNPIFLAAHLIMAFFLTLERAVSCFGFLLTGGPRPGGDTTPGSAPGTVPGTAPEDEQAAPTPDYSWAGVLAGGAYLFVLVIQLLAIFWSQSRGPWLGLASGMYIFVLLLLTAMRPRNYRAWTARLGRARPGRARSAYRPEYHLDRPLFAPGPELGTPDDDAG